MSRTVRPATALGARPPQRRRPKTRADSPASIRRGATLMLRLQSPLGLGCLLADAAGTPSVSNEVPTAATAARLRKRIVIPPGYVQCTCAPLTPVGAADMSDQLCGSVTARGLAR